MAPLPCEIEHRVDRHASLDGGRYAAVRIGRVAFAKQRVLSGERDERGEVPARGIAHERDTLGIDSELRSLSLRELHRGAHVLHRLGIGLLRGLGQAVWDREHGVAALGEPGPEDAVVVEIGEAPPSAVDRDHEGKFPRPLRRVQVPLQRYAAVNGILDFAALAGCTLHFFSLPVFRGGQTVTITLQ